MKTRKAFTLIEMLMVIAVISILAAFIVPAVTKGLIRAKLAKVKSELAQVEMGIAQFQASYGVNLPSGLFLCENAADWNMPASDPRYRLIVESRATLKTIWPQIDLTQNIDINRNGTIDPPVWLNGAECWVFFLGGTVDDGKRPNGFAKNPLMPFLSSFAPALALNRTAPFEFDLNRLVDLNNNGYKEYRDFVSIDEPILYLSSYQNRGYRVVDTWPVSNPLNIPQPPQAGFGSIFVPYTYPAVGNNPNSPYKGSSFQLIAPGFDGLLGYSNPSVGTGQYDQNNPVSSLAVTRPTDPTDPNYKGKSELDNLTNFTTGQLNQY